MNNATNYRKSQIINGLRAINDAAKRQALIEEYAKLAGITVDIAAAILP